MGLVNTGPQYRVISGDSTKFKQDILCTSKGVTKYKIEEKRI